MGKNHGKRKYVTRNCVDCGKELYVRSDSSRIRCDKCRLDYLKWKRTQIDITKSYVSLLNQHRKSDKVIEIKDDKEDKLSVFSSLQNTQSSLCWYCSNVYGGCSWSIKYEPIDGWEAIRNDLHVHTTIDGNMTEPRTVESYAVLECPQFIIDDRFKEEYANYSKEAIIQKLENRKRIKGKSSKKSSKNDKCAFSENELKVIGERIAEKRKEKGHTQRSFCNIIGVNLSTYKCWEQGRFPTTNTIKLIRLIGAALNYDYRFLIYGETENKEHKEKIKTND